MSLPIRSSLAPRIDDRSKRICRTIGDFAVYMHDFGFEHFDVNFRKDADCWNGSSIAACFNEIPSVERGYTWWCNKRPLSPCVFNCPTQVSALIVSAMLYYKEHDFPGEIMYRIKSTA